MLVWGWFGGRYDVRMVKSAAAAISSLAKLMDDAQQFSCMFCMYQQTKKSKGVLRQDECVGSRENQMLKSQRDLASVSKQGASGGLATTA